MCIRDSLYVALRFSLCLLWLSCLPAVLLSLCGLLWLSVCVPGCLGVVPFAQLLKAAVAVSGFPVAPVSYTHLEVYKRQSYTGAGLAVAGSGLCYSG